MFYLNIFSLIFSVNAIYITLVLLIRIMFNFYQLKVILIYWMNMKINIKILLGILHIVKFFEYYRLVVLTCNVISNFERFFN